MGQQKTNIFLLLYAGPSCLTTGTRDLLLSDKEEEDEDSGGLVYTISDLVDPLRLGLEDSEEREDSGERLPPVVAAPLSPDPGTVNLD